ncbi:hypothetical protein V8E53_008621 [Lactarius tabidus]
MSVVSGQKYRITNVRFELALHLSEDDDKFIVGEPISDSPRQWWTPVFLPDGTVIIRSVYHGLSIGFRTFLEGRAGLIATGDRNITRAWNIQPLDGKSKPLEYKISLPGSFLVMELPKDTRYAGIRVRLSEATGEAKLANQYWVFTRSLSLWATDSLSGVALEGRREDWCTARRGVKVAKFKA